MPKKLINNNKMFYHKVALVQYDTSVIVVTVIQECCAQRNTGTSLLVHLLTLRRQISVDPTPQKPSSHLCHKQITFIILSLYLLYCFICKLYVGLTCHLSSIMPCCVIQVHVFTIYQWKLNWWNSVNVSCGIIFDIKVEIIRYGSVLHNMAL